jgi:hypothetical protein
MATNYDNYIKKSNKLTSKTPFDKDGIYWQLIGAVKEVPRAEGSQGSHEIAFVVEKTILRCLAPNCVHEAGLKVSDVTTDTNPFFGATVQAAIAGIMGEPDKDTITGEDIMEAISPEQPICGIVCRVEVVTVPTKKGGEYTRTTYQGPVSWADVAQHVDPALIEAHFPAGLPTDEVEA